MKSLIELIDLMCEELESATDYAELFLQFSIDGNKEKADALKNMAIESKNHSKFLHELVEEKITQYQKYCIIPIETQKMWCREKEKYSDKTDWLNQMLSM